MSKDLFPIVKQNHVVFYRDGGVYCKKYLNMIKEAKKSIHLQTYIFELDRFGKKVEHELLMARLRGVEVYLLVDSVGSRNLPLNAEKNFTDAGIHFCRFNSIKFKWLYKWGRRLHHKVLLIDSEEAMIGGINVFYANHSDSGIPQLDFALYLKGPVTVELSRYCQNIFNKASNQKISYEKVKYNYHHPDGYEVGISVNDWINGRSKITKQYSRITAEAKKEINIINSYFFPRRKFMKQLADAAARGVKVRLILPKYSDWPSYILASEYLYEYFLKRGVEIYQWKKSILHGKLATVDDRWSTIGSFNLNYTSYQQNLEMNVDVYSPEFTDFLNKEIEQIIKTGCDKIDPATFDVRSPLKTRALRLMFYLILSIIAGFSIGLTFRDDHVKEHRVLHILRFAGAIIFLILGIIGSLLPIIPGFPFFIISFLLIYRQILLNKKIG